MSMVPSAKPPRRDEPGPPKPTTKPFRPGDKPSKFDPRPPMPGKPKPLPPRNPEPSKPQPRPKMPKLDPKSARGNAIMDRLG
jgi:hypothetical protein